MSEQGARVACGYCGRVRPGLGVDCPRCHGVTPALRPARMMDGPSSRQMLLRALLGVGDARAVGGPPYRDALLELLEQALLHGFDLVEALAEEIRRVEDAERAP